MTPEVNPTPHNNPTNPVPNVPADPDSDPILSYFYPPDLSNSSDNNYYRQRRRAKKNKNKLRIKTHLYYPIKKCTNITAPDKSMAINFKLD